MIAVSGDGPEALKTGVRPAIFAISDLIVHVRHRFSKPVFMECRNS